MTIEAKLPDGTTFQFPDGTADEVIDMKVKQHLASQITEGAAGIARPEAAVPAPNVAPPPAVAPTPSATVPEGGDFISAAGGEKAAETAGSIGEQLPQVAGGIVGGMVAGASGVGLPAAVGLVALGAAGGEGYKQLGQHLSRSLSAPKTSIEAAKRMGKAAATEGGWELVGGLATKGIGKILRPFKPAEGASEVMTFFDDKFKPILLPGEATESRVLDLVQNISESSIVGGSAISDFKVRRGKFFDDFADSLIDQFGQRTDPADLGNLFVTALENKQGVFRKASKAMYNRVKAGRVKVPTSSLKNFAGPLQKRGERLAGIEGKNAGDDLMDAIMELPDGISFNDATEIRSRLIARVDEYSVLNKKAPAIGKAKKLIGRMDQAIEKSLKGVGVGKSGEEFGVLWRNFDELPDKIKNFNDGERRFYRGTDPKATTPIRDDFYPIFSNKGGKRALWMAKDRASAANFGPKVEEILAKPNAKILYEGTDEFGKVAGFSSYDPKVPIENQISSLPGANTDFVSRTKMTPLKDLQSISERAKKAGYDAISFGYDSSVGTLVFNEKAFRRNVPSLPMESPLQAWRDANSFYRTGQEELNNSLLRRLVKLADDSRTGSEMIAPAIFKPGRVSTVRRVKKVLDPADWQKVQGFFMEHLLQKSTTSEGAISGNMLLNNMSGKPNSFGIPMLQETFSPPQIEALQQFGRAVQLSQKRQSEGAGKVLIQLSQAGAIYSMLTGTLEVPAATVIIAPAVLGKMMTNPRTAKLLIRGLTIPPGAPGTIGLVSRLTAAAWRVNNPEGKE